MTTINDRITNLEDAFTRVIPRFKNPLLLETITEKLDTIISTQVEHTALLNQHSIELELIKGYLG